MKKCIIINIIICILLMLPIGTYATGYDSLNIPSEEVNEVNVLEGEIVVKLYNGLFMYGFSEEMTVAELIDDKYVEEIYMIYSEDTHTTEPYYFRYLVIRDNGVEPGGGMLDGGPVFFKYAMSPELLFDPQTYPDIEIENIYCLDGEVNDDGLYIYYVTNQGDYVYYKEAPESEQEYLFPINDFYEFAKTVWAEVSNTDGLIGVSVSEIYDMTPYEIGRADNPNAFSWMWLVIGIVSVAVIALVTVTVIHLKKSKMSAK